MHFDWHFTAIQVLWTLTFAAQLVLMVVLLGRDRARLFPWFTASIVAMALRLLCGRLLYQRVPQLTFTAVLIVFSDVVAILGLLVIAELARKAFAPVRGRIWAVLVIALAATACGVPALIRPLSDWYQATFWQGPWGLLWNLLSVWFFANIALVIANARPKTFWFRWAVFALVLMACREAFLTVVASGTQSMWGPWPTWKTLTAESQVAVWRVLQLFAQKSELLVNLLNIELGLMVIIFGRHFKGPWKSHTQRIVIGLSTASLGSLAVQAIWQCVVRTAAPRTQAEAQPILNFHDRLINSSGALYVVVLIWWIVCLWIDEPGFGHVC